MKELYFKLSAVFAFSILLHIFYHFALINTGSGIIYELFYKVARVGWIGSDFILCAVGYYCFTIFSTDKNDKIKQWVLKSLKHFLWVIPSYYLILFGYLAFGIKILTFLEYKFVFNDSYLLPLSFFYSTILFAKGPWTGVALEGAFLLSMVVQLFVVFGIFVTFVSKRKFFLWGVGFFWGVAIYSRFVHNQDWHWFSYFTTYTRMDSFLAGITLAYLLKHDHHGILIRLKKILFFISLFVLFLAFLMTSGLIVSHEYTNFVAFPSLAFFSFASFNWIYSIQYSPSICLARFNIMIFSVYMMKLPLIYMSLAIVRRYFSPDNSLMMNVFALFISLFCCLIFGLMWGFIIWPILQKCTSPFLAIINK